ncbi:MAG: hypothetical protein WEA54_01085 [Actinomycetota bacterium]
MTLYLYEADTDDTSTCYGECADAWPALISDAATAGGGVVRGRSIPRARPSRRRARAPGTDPRDRLTGGCFTHRQGGGRR